MDFKIVRNLLNKVMYYESDIQVITEKAPEFAGSQFDKKLPKYVIIKDDKDNTYWCLKLNEYKQEYSNYIITKQDIYNNYTVIWSGMTTYALIEKTCYNPVNYNKPKNKKFFKVIKNIIAYIFIESILINIVCLYLTNRNFWQL